MNKFRENHIFSIFHSYELCKLPLDVFLRNYFREHKAIGAKDRRYIAETIYGMMRWRGLLDHLAPKPASWENRYACYTKINPQEYAHKKDIPVHIRASFPKTFFQLIQESYGEEKAFNLCQISNTPAPTTVRANLLKTTRDDLLNIWRDQYSVLPTLHAPCGITFQRKINFFDTEEFRKGFFEVQDEGSQLVANLIEALPKQQILDYCAGSGGKTLAFAPKMQNKGIIYLHDIRPHALEEAKKRLRRAGIQNAQLLYHDDKNKAKLEKKMDWVLADVPCTGTGTLRRNPDMKWKFDVTRLEALLLEQRMIFEKALQFLNADGKIVYATCSMLPQENQDQIRYFQEKFDLILDAPPFISLPSEGGMDGFFAAVLKTR
ncbi:MAG: RsmB/NOP family class I SAM-dependent RNA methyltransferase [Chlamydiota bacterium]